jgi:16S rRNA (uracil1498-N3)-methyltransferase
VAPTKNSDRLEWFLEKATEIGIDRMVPLHCTHSERKNINTDRLKKVAISAMKQSLKAWLPEVTELTKFETLIQEPFEGKKFIAHCYPGEKVHLKDALQPDDKALVLIGPEGDFSLEEVELAIAHGFTPVTLGTARLRTETAALVAVMTAALVCAE